MNNSEELKNVVDNTQLPLPSIIILKNSIEEGKMPKPEQLEVGELGLGLFEGYESIWAKNSAGNIIDLRDPRVDLFWGNFFRVYDLIESFELDLSAGAIPESSIVYIKETRQIWTAGTFFALSENEVLNLINSKVLLLPLKTSELTSESTSEEISEVFGGADEFKKLCESLKLSASIVAMKVNEGRGIVPVTASACTIECEYQCKHILTIEWIFKGKYYKEVITLNNDTLVFTSAVESTSKSLLEIVDNLDSLLDENKELVVPKISCSWEFYNNSFKPISVYPSPDRDNPIIEKGYKVVFKGVYSWKSEEGKKDPISISEDSTWKELTTSGVESSMFTSTYVTEDTEFLVKLEAPKTGFMVRGEDVIYSNGKIDVTEDKRKVSFVDRIYYGTLHKGSEKDIVEYDIRSLSDTKLILEGNLETKVEGVTTDEDEYYLIAFPDSLGDLKGIYQDGFPILGAFHKFENSIEVINAAGIGIDYKVYITNHPGVFTNVTIEFK